MTTSEFDNTEEGKGISIFGVSGLVCLVISSALVFYGIEYTESLLEDGFWYVTVARFFGIAAFFGGVVELTKLNWTSGVLLLVGSLVLPFVSLYFYGSL